MLFAAGNFTDQVSNAANWAASGTKLTYAAIGVGLVVGAILFAFSVLVVLMCYRLVPRGREVAATAASEVSTG